MTKADIVECIYERVGFSKKESADLVETVFDIIKDTLADGEKVKISGFGNFVVREKNARKQKLGQATFSLKWDRDCGAEKARPARAHLPVWADRSRACPFGSRARRRLSATSTRHCSLRDS